MKLWNYPFAFYFMPMGYQWIECSLFLIYLVYVAVYAAIRPIDGRLHTWPEYGVAAEIILWLMNFGFIAFEMLSFTQNTLSNL